MDKEQITPAKTQLDELNEFLVKAANARLGIRRKLVIIDNYIKNIRSYKK